MIICHLSQVNFRNSAGRIAAVRSKRRRDKRALQGNERPPSGSPKHDILGGEVRVAVKKAIKSPHRSAHTSTPRLLGYTYTPTLTRSPLHEPQERGGKGRQSRKMKRKDKVWCASLPSSFYFIFQHCLSPALTRARVAPRRDWNRKTTPGPAGGMRGGRCRSRA